MTAPGKASGSSKRVPRSLTREVLVVALARETALDRQTCARLLEDILATLSDRLATGETVRISGFGSFRVVQKSERPGRNPSTGAPVKVTPRRVVQFRPSARMRRRVAAATTTAALQRPGSKEPPGIDGQ